MVQMDTMVMQYIASKMVCLLDILPSNYIWTLLYLYLASSATAFLRLMMCSLPSIIMPREIN